MTNEERLEYLKNKQAMLILKECAYDSYPFNLARETFHSSDRLAHWMSDRVTLDVYKNLLVDAEKYLEKLEGEQK